MFHDMESRGPRKVFQIIASNVFDSKRCQFAHRSKLIHQLKTLPFRQARMLQSSSVEHREKDLVGLLVGPSHKISA